MDPGPLARRRLAAESRTLNTGPAREEKHAQRIGNFIDHRRRISS